MRYHLSVLPTAFFFFLLMPPLFPPALAECVMEQSPPEAATFTRHLGERCSEQEQETRAVRADELLAAIKEGKGIDLAGVVVVGDLLLDQLPPVSPSTLKTTSPRVQEMILSQAGKELRVVLAPISIRNSRVRGVISTKIQDGLIAMTGPVTMTGTTFERVVDFSRAVFFEPVDFSDAILLREGFFIRALFDKPTRFERTAFGVHTRFHRARFGDSVAFLRAGFNGLAEFLEVTFEKEANFSRTYFKMGTGFSGSRFGGMLDFSEALFEREAFFLFTLFEGDAYFRRTTFRGQADFSDAQFKGLDDFDKVFFQLQPRFDGARLIETPPTRGGLQDPRYLYGIAAAMLIFMVVFALVQRKR